MTLRHYFTLVLMIGGIAYLQWLMVPPPTAPRPVRLAEEAWNIPDQPKFDAKEALDTLNSASLWGKLADTALSASLAPPEWSFLGAIARGQERYVIIKIEGQPEQKLAPGDTLPGGAKILSIESDRLCLLINGHKRSLYIFSQGPLSGTMPTLEEETTARAIPAKRAKHAKRRNIERSQGNIARGKT